MFQTAEFTTDFISSWSDVCHPPPPLPSCSQTMMKLSTKRMSTFNSNRGLLPHTKVAAPPYTPAPRLCQPGLFASVVDFPNHCVNFSPGCDWGEIRRDLLISFGKKHLTSFNVFGCLHGLDDTFRQSRRLHFAPLRSHWIRNRLLNLGLVVKVNTGIRYRSRARAPSKPESKTFGF